MARAPRETEAQRVLDTILHNLNQEIKALIRELDDNVLRIETKLAILTTQRDMVKQEAHRLASERAAKASKPKPAIEDIPDAR